jgi:hypothetical protein
MTTKTTKQRFGALKIVTAAEWARTQELARVRAARRTRRSRSLRSPVTALVLTCLGVGFALGIAAQI